MASKWNNPTNIQIMCNEIQKSPGNLKDAFKEVSVQTDSSISAVAQAWYGGIRKKFPNFHTGSNSIVLSNTKNTPTKLKEKAVDSPVYEKVVSSAVYDGMKVLTIKQYYAV
jgi:hypothetical protein